MPIAVAREKSIDSKTFIGARRDIVRREKWTAPCPQAVACGRADRRRARRPSDCAGGWPLRTAADFFADVGARARNSGRAALQSDRSEHRRREWVRVGPGRTDVHSAAAVPGSARCRLEREPPTIFRPSASCRCPHARDRLAGLSSSASRVYEPVVGAWAAAATWLYPSLIFYQLPDSDRNALHASAGRIRAARGRARAVLAPDGGAGVRPGARSRGAHPQHPLAAAAAAVPVARCC